MRARYGAEVIRTAMLCAMMCACVVVDESTVQSPARCELDQCDPGEGTDLPPTTVVLLSVPQPWSEPTTADITPSIDGLEGEGVSLEQAMAQRFGLAGYEWSIEEGAAPPPPVGLSCGSRGSWIGCTLHVSYSGRFTWTCWVKTETFSAYCDGEGESEQIVNEAGQIVRVIRRAYGRCGRGRLRC